VRENSTQLRVVVLSGISVGCPGSIDVTAAADRENVCSGWRDGVSVYGGSAVSRVDGMRDCMSDWQYGNTGSAAITGSCGSRRRVCTRSDTECC